MKGVWVWPESEAEQERTLEKFRNSQHLVTVLSAIAKSKDGLSNAQIDQVLKSNSQWNTRWAVNELVALGLTDYNVDLFGGPGKYIITELGRNVFQRLTATARRPQAAAVSAAQPHG